MVTGALFLGSMFLTPLTSVVPLEVAAAALVVVGAMMMAQIREIKFTKFAVALPAFLTIVTMPLSYSIANGIGVGFVSWAVIGAASGKAKKIHPADVGGHRRLRGLLRAGSGQRTARGIGRGKTAPRRANGRRIRKSAHPRTVCASLGRTGVERFQLRTIGTRMGTIAQEEGVLPCWI